ncbi:hypothetical protein R5R35_011778 [Gryllus longicercus]|uniref:protein-L-isoaspartate(D-aspartate) O-methyltransferase n=1 Tax=Gryllus longicercus TaxID=2509291 RepID=A0AAN9VSW5_9ORTH
MGLYGCRMWCALQHAMALEDLRPVLSAGPQRKALDVGAGSGYMTAAMALLQSPPDMAPARPGQAQPLVVGIEHIPQLAQQAIENITRDQPDLLASGRVRIAVSDGRLGYPSEEPFDAIYVGAAALKEPEQLVKQLAPGGRMVVPVGELGHQILTVLQRGADGRVQATKKMESVFVPLTDARTQWSAAEPPPPPPPST